MEKEKFQYTYSAKQQEEVRKIRSKYAAPEEDKMEQLRRLDCGVTKKATAKALVAGVVGALIFGFGMSLIMTELGSNLGLSQGMGMAVGVLAGLAGFFLIGIAYPLYNRVLYRERERIAPEILRLTDELMK